MTYEVIVSPEADEQLRQVSDDWWQANRPKAPDLFADEFVRAIDQDLRASQRWS